MSTRRTLILPARGTLLVNTDLHGNRADLTRMAQIFERTLREDTATQWLILGDLVHGPSDEARQRQPELYDYPDESAQLVADVVALQARHPERIHYVLGNHDYGHIGGPHTRKFHDDEVDFLEATMSAHARAEMRALFSAARLAVVAPCGVFFAHGSPSDRLERLADLDEIAYPPPHGSYYEAILESFLTHYGQQADVTERLLATVSREGIAVNMVVQGHDRDEKGWFVHNGNQGCPVIFGAPRANKRYLRLDLSARYVRASDLRFEHEILRLYDAV
jgi:predicted phosphodiesterase